MTSTLSPEEYRKLSGTLAEWGMPSEQITEILSDAVFGPGVIGMQPERVGLGVGILVEETRDPELSALFEHRRRITDDRAFLANWRLGPVRIGTVRCPHSPEAIFGYSITIEQPIALSRTFLLLLSKQAHILSWLQHPATSVWLVPHSAGIEAWAKEGAGTAGELWAQCLPLGEIELPSVNLGLALKHVGYGR
jgi:hypothetical protein